MNPFLYGVLSFYVMALWIVIGIVLAVRTFPIPHHPDVLLGTMTGGVSIALIVLLTIYVLSRQ